MGQGGDIFTPATPESVLREAELLALRQMSDSMGAMTREMISHREMIAGIQQDVAVIKERQRSQAEMKVDMDKMEKRINELENRNTRQDGALSLVTFLKEFGPWLVSLAVLAWAFLSRIPK